MTAFVQKDRLRFLNIETGDITTLSDDERIWFLAGWSIERILDIRKNPPKPIPVRESFIRDIEEGEYSNPPRSERGEQDGWMEVLFR